MAKLAFTKLGLNIDKEVNTIEFNEQTIEVKRYLPVNDKLELISAVLNNSADENNFANPVKVEVFATIAIVEAYTNISFTDKQKENITKLYDMLVSSELYNMILNAIPTHEISSLFDALNSTIDAVYKYRNSILGVLESVSADYSGLNLDALNIQKALADPENMSLLKDVINKLG